MKALIRTVVIGIVGGMVLSSVPAGAIAAPGHFAIPASRSMELHAMGSGGFGINVSGSSSQVYLTVRGHHASNIYMVRGRVGSKEIKARFGHLGRVSMRFRVGHKARVPESGGNCKGGGEVIERGSFVGTLNFKGEQGYTTVRTVHALGRVVKSQRLVCEAEGEEGGGRLGPHWLLFDAISKSGHVSFRASKITSKTLPELDAAFFDASILETHPRGMSIIRTLDVQVDASAFKARRSHGHIATASAMPPVPFRGTAAYQRQGSTSSWTGTLTGVFPGRGEVRLAGPKFCAGFPFPPPRCAPSGSRFVFFDRQPRRPVQGVAGGILKVSRHAGAGAEAR